MRFVLAHARKALSLTVTAALSAALLLPLASPSDVRAAEAVVPRTFSAPEDIGTMVTAPAVMDSAYGVEDGKRVMYTTVTGNPNVADNPAYFNVVDLEDYRLIRSLPLHGGGQTWAHLVDASGHVYVASAGTLYRYSPVAKTVTTLGSPTGATALYGLTVDERGVVYGGTYPTGEIYKYDPAAGKISSYGRLSAGKDYVRSLAYVNGSLYAGTGAVGELYRIDPATGAKTLIPFPENAGFTPGSAPTVYAMNAVRDLLFIHMSSSHLLIYDTASGAWLPDVVSNYRGMYASPELDGKTYFVANDRFYAFDLDTRTATPTGAKFGSYFRKGTWVEVQGDPELPGPSLVTILYNGAVVLANFTTNVVKSWDPVVPGTPVSIQSLEFGPDGLLYSTGYQGTYGARYNIETGAKELFSMGQAEGMTPYGNKMIFGEYPAAHIHELDTTLPLERGVNPREIHEIGYAQDRPFALTTGDGMLFAGTIPKLGELGGAISVYDGTSWETFVDVVQDQSIMGLAYRDGKLYGSTTVWGGLNAEPTATEAKMFVWDVAAKRKIAEFTPAIQQAGGVAPKAIGGLSFGPDGLLWGAAYGTIFAMNPDTYEIVKQKEVIATDWVFGHYWVPVKLRWDPEGILYTTLGSRIVAIDPSTMAHTVIPGTQTNLMVLGPDGNLYYNTASMLKKITVSKEQPPVYKDVEVSLVNGGFEATGESGSIPGWERFGFVAGAAEYAVTTEGASEGVRSLKITDTSTTAEGGVISLPFAVEPGLEYTAKSDIFLQSGRVIFAMKYYDAAGSEIRLSPAPANYFSGPSGRWAPAAFSSIAPAGAATGRLVLFCSYGWIGTALYDNVKLFKKVAVEAPTSDPVAQELDVANAGFEALLDADGSIPGWNVRNAGSLVGRAAAVEVSSAVSRSGANSLYLFDNDTALEVAVDSDFVPVVGGRTYTVAMDTFRTSNPPGRSSNRPIVQVRFHDAAGSELRPVSGVTMSKEITSPLNQWGETSFSTQAPANAKFIRLILIGAVTYVASAYVDNATVTTIVEPADRTRLTPVRDPVSDVAEGEDVTFAVTATAGATIVVKEGERTVAEAAGAGDDAPVTVTIPSPPAGTHAYTVYATVPGLGKSASVALPPVTVHPLSRLAFDVPSLAMGEEETASLRVTGYYGPFAIDVTPLAAFSADDAGVVTLEGSVATAVGGGETTVRATVGGAAASLPITVQPFELVSMTVTLSETTVGIGASVTASVYGLYSNGRPQYDRLLPLTAADVELSASPAGLVAIDGLTLTAVDAGQVIVTAASGGVVAEAALTVLTPEQEREARQEQRQAEQEAEQEQKQQERESGRK